MRNLALQNKRIPVVLIYLLIFAVAFIPRALALDAYVASDESLWVSRSAHFLQALLAGDLAGTTSVAASPEVDVLAPAVPTMWTGAMGLAAKYWVEGSPGASSLTEYLAALPNSTEKIPLHFFPWARFPTVLLASLSVPLFYYLLSKLIEPGTALLAVLLLALDPFFISLSRVIHHDALVSIFIVASLLALLVYRREGNAWPWLIMSGIGGGLALLTKPTALFLVAFVGLFLLFERGFPRRRPEWRAAILDGLSWGAIALATFVIIWPALWVAPIDTFTGLFQRSTSALDDGNNYSLMPWPDAPIPELGIFFYPVNWLFKATLPAMIGLVALASGWRRGWFRTKAGDETSTQADQTTALPPTSRATLTWLAIFILLFLSLLMPADTRDVRYFLPAVPPLYVLAAAGIMILISRLKTKAPRSPRYARSVIGLLLACQLLLAVIYYPYYVDYWNPVIGGPWLAPQVMKVGSGEGLDQMAAYLNQKPNVTELTVATSFWESFVPFYAGPYTKAHYDEEADYILIYRRQIQNRNPFAEYWSYFSARPPEHKIALVGLDYAWLYPGPQLRVIRDADFGHGLALRGYRLEQPAAQPGRPAHLTLVWAGATPDLANRLIEVELIDAAGQVRSQAEGTLLDPQGPSPVEGHVRLDLLPETPRADYELWVFLPPAEYEFGTGARLKVGSIPVRQLEKPNVSLAASINFGNLITFGGADVQATTLSPGDTIEVTFWWQARQPMARSYTTFAHVVDEAGQIWAQADRIPTVDENPLPTDMWDKGEWIGDTFQLTLKPDTPPGQYSLLAGVYDSQTFERLPAISEQAGQTVVHITSLNIP